MNFRNERQAYEVEKNNKQMLKLALTSVVVVALVLVAGYAAHAGTLRISTGTGPYGPYGGYGAPGYGGAPGRVGPSTTTTPGTPNTGAGGEAASNALLLGSSALIALLGAGYLVRRSRQ